MIRVLFICHGNICRSPMAEYVLKNMVNNNQYAHYDFEIASAATSTEEIGNDIHRGTKGILNKYHIPYERRRARQITRSDYQEYDYLIGMDSWNRRNILRIVGDDPQRKVYNLLEFAGSAEDIADPWYTGEFETTYRDVCRGCEGFLQMIKAGRRALTLPWEEGQ